MEMILYGMPHTRSFRALWALEEVGATYRYQLVQLGRGEGQSASFLALNPAGKLPVLKDGGLVLTESAAICTYLADSFSHKELIPQVGSADRGRYNQWCFFILSELEQPLWTLAKHKFALPKAYRVRAIQPSALYEFERATEVLAKGLSGRKYLVGESFTMADLLATHALMWAQAFKVEQKIAELDSYREEHCRRAAYQRAMAIEAEKEKELK